ncbi:uncharacterized protein LOC134530238 [Bacillus rossius redtenbacheri]|uniref:uncharacterized protein LOC134530238 n=1 Tax=Bacillus rossius redtenbacheri TaxID=93214 RepID=UPI002FDEB0F8
MTGMTTTASAAVGLGLLLLLLSGPGSDGMFPLRSTCPGGCPKTYQPQCAIVGGRKLHTFANFCTMYSFHCRNNMPVYPVGRGKCEELYPPVNQYVHVPFDY